MNVAEQCSREIERVTVLRAAFSIGCFLGDPRAAAAIAHMIDAIEAAHAALGSGDVIAIIITVRELKACEI